MTTVPSFMPDIRSGYHAAPEKGGCVMQVTSFLYNEGWTDKPECTDVGLADVAIGVNDSVTDDARRGLLAAVPDLIGTAWLVDDAGLDENDEDAAVDSINAWVQATFPYGDVPDEDVCPECTDRWNCLCDRLMHAVQVSTCMAGPIPNFAPYYFGAENFEEGSAKKPEIELVADVFGRPVADCIAGGPIDWRKRQHDLVAWFVTFVRKYRELFGGDAEANAVDEAEWRRVADVMAPA